MQSKSPVLIFLAIILTCAFLIYPGIANSQNQANGDPAATPKDAEKPKLPDLSEVVIQAAELGNRLSDLRGSLKKVFNFEKADKSFTALNESIAKLGEELLELQNSEKNTYEQLTAIKTSIRRQDTGLTDQIDLISAAIRKVGSWNREWKAESARWEMWRAAILQEMPIITLESTFTRSHNNITEALSLISQHLEPLLEAQLKAQQLGTKIYTLTATVNNLIFALTGGVLQDNAPSMFSSRYYSQFGMGLMVKVWRNIKSLLAPDGRFFVENGWVIALQVLLILLMIAGIRRFKDSLNKSEQYGFIAQRPISTGLLLAVFILVPFYGPVPPFWQLILWGVSVFSTARLAEAFPVDWLKKWLIYGFAILSVATHFCLVTNLPLPILRLYLMAVAAAGLVYFGWRSIRSARRGRSPVYIWILRLGSALFLVLLVSNILGYIEFATRLLDSSIRTIFLILQGWIVVFALRGALKSGATSNVFQKLSFLRNNAAVIVKRSTMLINLMVGVFLVIWILISWRIYQGPMEALQNLFAFGITMGSRKITVGLILGALGILYGAFLVSWSIQAVLMEEVLRRRHVEVGVRLSMSRLLHYALVLVGFFLALAWLGFNLQNITILGGALGVGIGFGLQTVVNNFVCGLIMLFERPVKVGDSIQLGAEFGQIKKVGLRATVVQTYDNSEIVVPNSDLITNQVTNWTLAERKSRIKIPIGVAYGSDVPLVMQTLLDCAQEHPLVLQTPAPKTLFMGFGDSSLDFELRAWVKDFDDRAQVGSELRLEIEKRFRAAEIEIPFPQRDLHLRSIVAAAALPLQNTGLTAPVAEGSDPIDSQKLAI
jgi:small-conductance mechanosensitive channel